MRRLAVTLLFGLALLLPAPSQAQMTVKKLTEGVWASNTPNGANVGWFIHGDEVIVVDSGPNAAAAEALLGKIRETTSKPIRFLIITHAHGDHAGGVAVFRRAGAQVICSDDAAPQLLAVMQADKDEKLSGAPTGKRAGAAKPAAAPTPQVLSVGERLSFLGSSRRFEVYFLGAAHTRGDLIVILPEEKILFSGDLVVNSTLPFMQAKDVDARGWERILGKVMSLPVNTLVPGHGPIGPTDGMATTLTYVHGANQIVKRLLDAGVTEDQLDQKLRDPENQIEKIVPSAEHIANVKAVYNSEKMRPAPRVSPTPAK